MRNQPDLDALVEKCRKNLRAERLKAGAKRRVDVTYT